MCVVLKWKLGLARVYRDSLASDVTCSSSVMCHPLSGRHSFSLNLLLPVIIPMTQLLPVDKWYTSSPIMRAPLWPCSSGLVMLFDVFGLQLNEMLTDSIKVNRNCLPCCKVPSRGVSLLARALLQRWVLLSSRSGLLGNSFLWQWLSPWASSQSESVSQWSRYSGVIWWRGGVFDTKTWKKAIKFFATEGRAIVTHDFIWGAFQSEQLFKLLLWCWQSWWTWSEIWREIY